MTILYPRITNMIVSKQETIYVYEMSMVAGVLGHGWGWNLKFWMPVDVCDFKRQVSLSRNLALKDAVKKIKMKI